MKKIVYMILVVLLLFVSCEMEPEHEHTFSSEWTCDAEYHWHEPTCGHDVVSGKAKHSWDDGIVIAETTASEERAILYTCTVCGKTKRESGNTGNGESPVFDSRPLVYIYSDVMMPDTVRISVSFTNKTTGKVYDTNLTVSNSATIYDIPIGDYTVEVTTNGLEVDNCGEYSVKYNQTYHRSPGQSDDFIITVDNQYLRENGRSITYHFDENAQLGYFRCLQLGFSYGNEEQAEYLDYPRMAAVFSRVSDGESRTIYLTNEYLRGNNGGCREYNSAGGKIITKPFEWSDLQQIEGGELYITTTYGEGRTAFLYVYVPGLTESQREQLERLDFQCGEDRIGGYSHDYLPKDDYSYRIAVKTGPQQICSILKARNGVDLDFDLVPDIENINLNTGDTQEIHFSIVEKQKENQSNTNGSEKPTEIEVSGDVEFWFVGDVLIPWDFQLELNVGDSVYSFQPASTHKVIHLGSDAKTIAIQSVSNEEYSAYLDVTYDDAKGRTVVYITLDKPIDNPGYIEVVFPEFELGDSESKGIWLAAETTVLNQDAPSYKGLGLVTVTNGVESRLIKVEPDTYWHNGTSGGGAKNYGFKFSNTPIVVTSGETKQTTWELFEYTTFVYIGTPDFSNYPEFSQMVQYVGYQIGQNGWYRNNQFTSGSWTIESRMTSFGENLPVTSEIKLKDGYLEDDFPYMLVPNVATLTVEEGNTYSVSFTVMKKQVDENPAGVKSVTVQGEVEFNLISKVLLPNNFFLSCEDESGRYSNIFNYLQNKAVLILNEETTFTCNSISDGYTYSFVKDEYVKDGRTIVFIIVDKEMESYAELVVSVEHDDYYSDTQMTTIWFDASEAIFSDALDEQWAHKGAFPLSNYITTLTVKIPADSYSCYSESSNWSDSDTSRQMWSISDNSFQVEDGEKKQITISMYIVPYSAIIRFNMADILENDVFSQNVKSIEVFLGNTRLANWSRREWSENKPLGVFDDKIGKNLSIKTVITLNNGVSEEDFPYTIVPSVENLTLEKGKTYSVSFSVVDKQKDNPFVGVWSMAQPCPSMGCNEVLSMVFASTEFQMIYDIDVTDISQARTWAKSVLTDDQSHSAFFDYSLTETDIDAMESDVMAVLIGKYVFNGSHVPCGDSLPCVYEIDEYGYVRLPELDDEVFMEIDDNNLVLSMPGPESQTFETMFGRDENEKQFTSNVLIHDVDID